MFPIVSELTMLCSALKRCRVRATLPGVPLVQTGRQARLNSSFYKPLTGREKKKITKEELDRQQQEMDLKSKYVLVRWIAKLKTQTFQKRLTWWYIGAYAVFLLLGYKYMKGVYNKEKELEQIHKKVVLRIDNEYDRLREKFLTGNARRRDELKLEEYDKLKAEGVDDFDGITVDAKSQNSTNESILPAHDTTPFFDGKAEEYDSDINFEERLIFMGRKRKWLMKHCKGDVLEVSCGTGRNIKYLDIPSIHSITFLDSSPKMMELTNKKFREQFPAFKNAAFVVGKAEDLINLAEPSGNQKVKYDTIVEAFGLCSHEDPVKALNNFQQLLKPDGRIILLEHGRGKYDFVNEMLDKRAQHRLETWGCRWNLDIGELLDDSGLEIIEEKRSHLGTTWCIVAKRKEDAKRSDEVTFVEKYISPAIQKKAEELSKIEERQILTNFKRNKLIAEKKRKMEEEKKAKEAAEAQAAAEANSEASSEQK